MKIRPAGGRRKSVSPETELSKLQARLAKEIEQHAETKRQLTELDARYMPLVSENDELRERVHELEGERSLASARAGKLTENSGVKLAAAKARVRELEKQIDDLRDQSRALPVEWCANCDKTEARVRELESVNASFADIAMQTEQRREAAESKTRTLREKVQAAYDRANGRWCEWGERALMVAEMLEEALRGS